ncbi:MAG: preprotein translocase subunit YajC [Clostridium sp.]|uniref:preprotein translocase subunit YajC n=1 Tax=Clostridium sp. TaxID=1506 RepID=UPI00290B48D7|nr:preprotein translocase subunit YajC [Clostridium sp.]MDU7337197.1 preprotein translocase subunit YajC [Clostridium sp.]
MNQLLPLAATAAASGSSIWQIVIIYGLLFGALYFFMIRPQQKKKKAEEALKKNVQVGDEITTIGGIVGRIVAIKEESDTFVLESGIDRTKIIVKRWALGKINTVHEDDK